MWESREASQLLVQPIGLPVFFFFLFLLVSCQVHEHCEVKVDLRLPRLLCKACRGAHKPRGSQGRFAALPLLLLLLLFLCLFCFRKCSVMQTAMNRFTFLASLQCVMNGMCHRSD